MEQLQELVKGTVNRLENRTRPKNSNDGARQQDWNEPDHLVELPTFEAGANQGCKDEADGDGQNPRSDCVYDSDL